MFDLGRLGAGGHARARRWFALDSRWEWFRLVGAHPCLCSFTGVTGGAEVEMGEGRGVWFAFAFALT